jgi:type II secretory pathway component PulC
MNIRLDIGPYVSLGAAAAAVLAAAVAMQSGARSLDVVVQCRPGEVQTLDLPTAHASTQMRVHCLEVEGEVVADQSREGRERSRRERRERREAIRQNPPSRWDSAPEVVPIEPSEVHYAALERDAIAQFTMVPPARFLPHNDRDGNVDGFRLSGIFKDSPLADLGFVNGDVVHTVAGESVTNTSGGLAAYKAIEQLDVVDVDVTRRGERHRIRLQIE